MDRSMSFRLNHARFYHSPSIKDIIYIPFFKDCALRFRHLFVSRQQASLFVGETLTIAQRIKYHLDAEAYFTLPVLFNAPHPCNSPFSALLNDLIRI